MQTNLGANLIWACSYSPRKPLLRWRTWASTSEMLLFIKSEGWPGETGDGFMGQFAFTRAPAQITSALIRLPKWGSHAYDLRPNKPLFIFPCIFHPPFVLTAHPRNMKVLKHRNALWRLSASAFDFFRRAFLRLSSVQTEFRQLFIISVENNIKVKRSFCRRRNCGLAIL